MRPRCVPQLVIMVKEPSAGRVKTRLAKGIGPVAATSAYRVMMACLVARLSSDPRWQTVLAVSPDGAMPSRAFPNGRRRIPQGSGDIGARLQRVFLHAPPGPIVVIGTDIPAITQSDIAAAFRALGNNDAVLGPSDDGGYWLVGLARRRRLPQAFRAVRWSSEHALADTEANLSGYAIARLRQLDDVDTVREFQRLKAIIGRRILPRFSGFDGKVR